MIEVILFLLGTYILYSIVSGNSDKKSHGHRLAGGRNAHPLAAIPILRSGELEYCGEPGTKMIYNRRWKVRGRPDFVFKMPDGSHSLVEFKSRKTRVYPKDIVQTKASVLVASGKYRNIKKAYVLLGSGEWTEVALPSSVDALADELMPHVRRARKIKYGQRAPALTPGNHCIACNRSNCHNRVMDRA
jgi:hypothetical protein